MCFGFGFVCADQNRAALLTADDSAVFRVGANLGESVSLFGPLLLVEPGDESEEDTQSTHRLLVAGSWRSAECRRRRDRDQGSFRKRILSRHFMLVPTGSKPS